MSSESSDAPKFLIPADVDDDPRWEVQEALKRRMLRGPPARRGAAPGAAVPAGARVVRQPSSVPGRLLAPSDVRPSAPPAKRGFHLDLANIGAGFVLCLVVAAAAYMVPDLLGAPGVRPRAAPPPVQAARAPDVPIAAAALAATSPSAPAQALPSPARHAPFGRRRGHHPSARRHRVAARHERASSQPNHGQRPRNLALPTCAGDACAPAATRGVGPPEVGATPPPRPVPYESLGGAGPN